MDSNKRIALNSIVIFAKLCLSSFIGIFSSRFVLQALGASDYGLYNVVGGIVVMLNVLNTSMVTTTYRYIAYEIGKGSEGNPNKVFNTSFFIHLGFALLIILLGATVGEWYINNYLNVDPSKLPDAHFVFRISVLTAVLNTCFIPYHGLMVAIEKFLPTTIFDISVRILNLVAVIFLLSYLGNRLRVYSLIAIAGTALNCLMIFIYLFYHNRRIIRLKFYKDNSLYKEMFSFTGWIILGAAARMGKSQGGVIIINYFFGTLVNAAYGVAKQLESYILMFSRSLNQAAIPQITKGFSGENHQRSLKLANYISKYTFILMSLVAFPIITEMDFILGIWLKEVPEGSTIFCQLLILDGFIQCLGAGIPALIQASGKIKLFQIVGSVLSLIGIPIAIVCYMFGASPYTILIVYCSVSILIAITRLVLLKFILNIDVKSFIRTSYYRMFLISCPMVGLYLLYNPSSFTFIQHLLGLCGLETFLILCIAILGFDQDERVLIRHYAEPYLKKIKC